jgi:alkanesulfonate monooxygenase SsuD/methylene tetrahydromethanopterin reductase-like flavin-dependent oxidoreductase (luciferase family)
VTRFYKQNFKPTEKRAAARRHLPSPSSPKAARMALAAPIDLRRLHGAQHRRAGSDLRRSATYSDEERRYVLSQRARAVIGGPEKAKRELLEMTERYAADELMVLTITGDYDSRRRSYELLIGAF